jgi:predicted GIY-YIG superfamily endonuclease
LSYLRENNDYAILYPALNMFYVYLLKNEKGFLYIGCTNDLKRRLEEHNSGKSQIYKRSSMGSCIL